jgi:hypothetical protein
MIWIETAIVIAGFTALTVVVVAAHRAYDDIDIEHRSRAAARRVDAD